MVSDYTPYFKTQNGRQEVHQGTVHLINKTVNQAQRTISVYGHILNEQLKDAFNPGMYVEAEIVASSLAKASLPSDAVVEIEGKYYVLVRKASPLAEYAFQKQGVTIGQTNNANMEILNAQDFGPNAEFLTQGAYNLITE